MSVSFALGLTTQFATGDHWHATGPCAGAWHSFVHGSSSTDRAYRAQVERGSCGPSYHFCVLYNADYVYGPLDSHSSYYGTCDADTHSTEYFQAECKGYARAGYSNVFSEHIHVAHDYCDV